jgi:hypothetical protein
MDTGGPADRGLYVAADMHDLSTSGARAAAVPVARRRLHARAGQASFTGVSSRRCARSWPGLSGLGLLVIDGYADLNPDASPASAPTCTPSPASR